MFKGLNNLIYSIYFYLLGSLSILEDIFLRRNNKCELRSRKGEVAVITGGTRGIGAEVVRKLLLCEMHVVIGCRNVSAGSEMVRGLRARGVTSGSTSILPLDMASLDSVRAFASAVLNARPKIHLLVNNAGIMLPHDSTYSETGDGWESQWGVNYLGHFLLSHLLLPALHQTAEAHGAARIVNVTSCAHRAAYPIDFDNVNMRSKEGFIPLAAYAQSKAAQLMASLHTDATLRRAESRVRVVAVHPGVVNTDIFDGSLVKTFIPWLPSLIFKTAEEGATTVMFAALHAKGGEYISNGRAAYVSALARDPRAQADLFNYSKRSLGITQFGGLPL